jgi:hypothetical protein
MVAPIVFLFEDAKRVTTESAQNVNQNKRAQRPGGPGRMKIARADS